MASVIYQFQPLLDDSSIRLLTLLPGKFDRAIYIALEQFDLTEAATASYEALSYAWGDGTLAMPIFCGQSVLRITENLFQALQYLRNDDIPRLLWIDAICINQSDLIEKDNQIPLIGNIYTLATEVLIWLSQEDETSGTAFSTILKWAEWNKTPGEVILENVHDGPKQHHETITHRTRSLESLFQRPWFHRAWTFQEVCLGRHALVMCGSLKIEFAGFVMAYLTAEKTSFGDYFDQIRDMMLTWYNVNILKDKHTDVVDLSLSTLLHSTQLRQAKDPRDRIYSLLGLATGNAVRHISPSYALPVENVYTQYVAAMIEDDKNLNILSDTERDGRNPNLPSWVPDWASHQLTYSMARPRSVGLGMYSINRGTLKDFTFKVSFNKRKLSLEGARIDHITRIFSLKTLLDEIELKRYGLFHERQKQLCAISRLVELTGIEHSGSCTREMAEIVILRTVCADWSALSSSISDENKAKNFGWHNRAMLKQRCSPRRNSDLRQPRDYVVRANGDYGEEDPDTENDSDPYQPQEWVAVEEDIRLLYRILFEEERACRQKYRLLRRRKSDSQILFEDTLVGET